MTIYYDNAFTAVQEYFDEHRCLPPVTSLANVILEGSGYPAEVERLRAALSAIVNHVYVCSSCGVEYADYEGPCQEPMGVYRDGRWSRTCTGIVSAASTAQRALRAL